MALAPLPLVARSYELASRPAASQRLLNLYPERLPAGGREGFYLKPVPGLRPFTAMGAGPILAMASIPGYLYVLSGSGFYRVTGNGSEINHLGDVGTGDFPTIAVGADQVVVCVPPRAYVADHDGTLSQITTGSGNFPVEGASSVATLDGYFVFTSFRGEYFFVSNLLDGGTFDSLDYATSERRPDYVTRAIAHNGEIWLFGEVSSAVWYNSGASDFPFRERAGSIGRAGLGASLSLCEMDGALFWLGSDRIVYRSDGYQARRISTHAIEEVLAEYERLSTITASAHAFEGHSFYCLSLPLGANESRTLVFDAATGEWHERSSGAGRWRINCASRFWRFLLLGSSSDGTLFELDPELGVDASGLIRRLAVLPVLVTHGPRAFMSRLEVEMEVGTDGAPGTVGLDWSDDGGISWSSPRALGTGLVGKTRTRVATARLGSFRQRVLRLEAFGRCVVYGVDADVSPGSS